MKWLRNLLDKVAPLFEKDGKLEALHPLYEATDTILFSTDEKTHSGPHIKDSIDIKKSYDTCSYIFNTLLHFRSFEYWVSRIFNFWYIIRLENKFILWFT